MNRVLLITGLIALSLVSCKKETEEGSLEKVSADVVVSWNAFSIKTAKNKGFSSNLTSRILAIEAIAVYDAVNSISQFGTPYHYSAVWSKKASREAAAAQAAHDVLANYFPSQRNAIDSALDASLADVRSGSIEEGQRAGAAAAADIIALRANDGSELNQTYSDPAILGMCVYRSSPPYYSAGVSSHWGGVKPFILSSCSQFRPAAPPAPGSESYNTSLLKVQEVGSANSTVRTSDQTHIAQFFRQDAELTINAIAKVLISDHQPSIEEAAHALVLTQIAGADINIALYDAKYAYLFWRPITALNANSSGVVTNNYRGWTPLLSTPSHPSYPCAHCGAVDAGLEMLKTFYGDKGSFSLKTTTSGEPNRSYQSLTAVEEENSWSRIYAGVHYPFDMDAGVELAKKVVAYTLEKGPRKK